MKHLGNTFARCLNALFLSSVFVAHSLRADDEKTIVVRQEPMPPAEDDWRFSLTPYFWLPSSLVDISVPTVRVGNRTLGGEYSVNQPWWETLGKFSSNFYILSVDARMELWKGRWGGFLDGYWIFGKSSVSGSDSRVGPRGRVDVTTTSSVTSRFGVGQVNFGPQVMLGTVPLGAASSVSFVLYGGGRVNWVTDDVDGTIKIVASAEPGEVGQTTSFNSSSSRTFIEPMIGLKTQWKLGEHFDAILRGDVGGFGVVEANNWDCDLEAALAWKVMPNVSLDLGYRARGIWQDDGPNGDVTISGWFFGPELGLTVAF